ncbi:hypothetical protein G6F50_017821 [Rhizopus delemar]|uniref:DEAD-box RNA helicase Q domain-containing protein n=1 Tax=Rhizopus delemar TaxID=936053 RepID=A0A9P7BZS4_9FUNG|nr:hypothetical protein G6F50_017821 [Rhizopus delemar]
MQAVTAIGYETPSPIQAATIPAMLEGRDVLGQAQTADQAPGPDPGADPRAGHPGGRGVPVVFVEDPGLPRAAGVRRPAVRPAAVGAAPRPPWTCPS